MTRYIIVVHIMCKDHKQEIFDNSKISYDSLHNKMVNTIYKTFNKIVSVKSF